MSKWEPIETAPKDGSEILGVFSSENYYCPTTVAWKTYHPNAQGKATWRESQSGHKTVLTHWMPLPKKPSEES